MRTAIKVAALVAAVCAVAAIALAGGAVASGGHAGDGFGIMNGHGGTDALNGHGMGHRNGECTSNDCHEHRGTCEMAADRTAACDHAPRLACQCSASCPNQDRVATAERDRDHVRGCH